MKIIITPRSTTEREKVAFVCDYCRVNFVTWRERYCSSRCYWQHQRALAIQRDK